MRLDYSRWQRPSARVGARVAPPPPPHTAGDGRTTTAAAAAAAAAPPGSSSAAGQQFMRSSFARTCAGPFRRSIAWYLGPERLLHRCKARCGRRLHRSARQGHDAHDRGKVHLANSTAVEGGQERLDGTEPSVLHRCKASSYQPASTAAHRPPPRCPGLLGTAQIRAVIKRDQVTHGRLPPCIDARANCCNDQAAQKD